MPQPTYTPLATVTLGSSASSVTLSNIPATYRDLILVFLGTGTTGANFALRANGDTGSNYTLVRMFNNVNTPSSGTGTEPYFYVGGVGTTIRSQIMVSIMDSSATDKHKTALAVQDIGGDTTMRIATRWANTAAITTLGCSLTSGSFAAGATFNLYGIAS